MLRQSQSRSADHPLVGSYYHSDTSLYLVEEKRGDHALVEDCSTGQLLDMDVRAILRLTPVRMNDAADSKSPSRAWSEERVGNTG
jgi:hypothetical protein